jgi:AraC-like DNA-binding protein
MRRATELLDAHLDGNIALQQVAEACDLSLGHFARAFKKTFRRPPHTWLTELRVEKAKDLMMSSRLSLADGRRTLAITVPAAQATARTQPAAGAKTVILVHGAWADGSSWSKVIPLLEAKGLHVVAVQIR